MYAKSSSNINQNNCATLEVVSMLLYIF